MSLPKFRKTSLHHKQTQVMKNASGSDLLTIRKASQNYTKIFAKFCFIVGGAMFLKIVIHIRLTTTTGHNYQKQNLKIQKSLNKI